MKTIANEQGRRDGGGGGQLGRFALGPTLLMCPKRSTGYTLIEQLNTLLKQSLHIFYPGPLKLSLRPC